MSEFDVDLAATLVGFVASVLGIVSLVETHRHSHVVQRLVVALLVLLCIKVALDSFFALLVDGVSANRMAAAFAFTLGVSWFGRILGGPRK